jgi:hypothetical protein
VIRALLKEATKHRRQPPPNVSLQEWDAGQDIDPIPPRRWLARSHVTETTEHVPGDVTAQMKWLSNCRPDKWREKIDVTYERLPERTGRAS